MDAQMMIDAMRQLLKPLLIEIFEENDRRQAPQRENQTPSSTQQPERYTTEQVAKIYGIKAGTLKGWRSQGKGPAFSKCGGHISYAKTDLDNFFKAGRVKTIDQRY